MISIGISYPKGNNILASWHLTIIHQMNIRSFVTASSLLLAVWLTATYFHELSPDRYRQHEARKSVQLIPTVLEEETAPAIVQFKK